ncbi:hypothetical protein BDC45DRAFT_511941 [Circinella umbellata]|nr:hypothetical protein BDC45DRAFT_511941 [Circinella umbellata]
MNNNNSSPRRSARLCRPTTRYDPIQPSGRNQRRRRRGNQLPPTEQDLFNDATINNTIPTRILRRSRRLNSQQQPQQQQQINTEQTTSHGLPVSPSSLLRNVLEAPSRVTGPAMLADVITQAVVNAYRDRRNNNNSNNNNTSTTTTENNNNNNNTNENNNNSNSNDLSVSTSTPVPAPAFDPSLLDITPDANSEENSFFRFVRLPLHVPSNDTSEIVMPMFIVGYRTQQEVTSTPPEHLQQPDQEQQTQEQVHILPPQTQLPQEETVVIGDGGETQEEEGRGGNGSGAGRRTLRRSQRIREIRRRQQQREDEERENNNNRRYTVSRWIIYFISGMDNPNYDDLVAAWQAEHRNTGLTIEQIHANAPQQPFSAQIANTLIGGSEQCHVCLEKFELLENVRVLPCQHGFHQECIDKWLMEAQNRCPLCRNAVVPLSSLL